MNTKIFLLIGTLVLSISKVVADEDPDINWIVDVTNQTSSQIPIGRVKIDNEFSGSCWYLNSFQNLTLRRGESRRIFTVEMAHTGAYLGDPCTITNGDPVTKFMDIYINDKEVRLQAQYYPTHTNLSSTNKKSIWSVLVKGNLAGNSKEIPEAPVKPYVHIIYGSGGNITATIGTQDKDMPENFYANDKW